LRISGYLSGYYCKTACPWVNADHAVIWHGNDTSCEWWKVYYPYGEQYGFIIDVHITTAVIEITINIDDDYGPQMKTMYVKDLSGAIDCFNLYETIPWSSDDEDGVGDDLGCVDPQGGDYCCCDGRTATVILSSSPFT